MKILIIIAFAFISTFQIVRSSNDRVFTLEELKKYNGKDVIYCLNIL